jgi:hypothetical protein
MDAHDAITLCRKALFEAGGIQIERQGNRGRMAPTDPKFQGRADAYNALADLHAEMQIANLAWTKGRLSPAMHEFRGFLGKHYRIVFGEDRGQLERTARKMAAGHA